MDNVNENFCFFLLSLYSFGVELKNEKKRRNLDNDDKICVPKTVRIWSIKGFWHPFFRSSSTKNKKWREKK